VTELSRRRRIAVLLLCCTSLFIVSLDATIVNIALPVIARDLHAPISGMQWVVDAYVLVVGGLLMLSGSTADRVGRRRVFQIGLALFSLGSLLCSVAPSLGWLIAFRMLQATGGSMLNPVAMSIIANVFTDPRERARAIGVWGGIGGISLAAGPPVGGLIVETLGWPGIFWINVPIGVATIVLTALLVPESRAPRPRRLDPLGQLLVMATLTTLCFGIIEGPNLGWSAAPVLGCFAVAALCLAALLWYEPRRDDPLIDLRFFRSAPFSGAVAIAVCSFAALGGFLFINTIYLQNVRGLTPLEAGIYTLPMALATLVLSPVSGRLVAARGARPPLTVAGVLITLAGLLLTRVTADTPVLPLLVVYVVFGAGFGLVNAPLTNTAVSGMPRAQAGVAAAVSSTGRQVGQLLGVAIAGSIVASSLAVPRGPEFAHASEAVWWMVAGYGALVLALGLATTGRRAYRTAARVAERLFHEEPSAAAAGRGASSGPGTTGGATRS
jgi:EmrB/QacA subfamily drug resistance transporter